MPERTKGLLFSKRQALLISSAVSLLALAVVSAIVLFGVTIAFRFVSRYSTVLLPPILAIICANIVQPEFDWLRAALWRLAKRSNRGFVRGLATAVPIAVIFAAIFVPVAAFFWFFGKLMARQLLDLANAVPDAVRWACAAISRNLPQALEFVETHKLMPLISRLDPSKWFDAAALTSLTSHIGGYALSIGSILRGWAGTLLGWVALPVYTAIYLASRPLNGSDFGRVLVGLSEKTRNNVVFLIDEFIRIVVAFFRGQVVVALIQGALFGLGFQFVANLRYGMLIGIILGLFNIVPYLGNILCIPAILLFALFGAGGGVAKAGTVVLLFCAVQTLDSYFITPRVMGSRTGLNSFVIIFSLFFWEAVIGGALGMVLAIPLSAFIVVFWRLLLREYFGDAHKAEPAKSAEARGEAAAGNGE
jgi:Predicted permease